MYKLHPDDEWFDEIRFETGGGPLLRIVTRPRYKTSELSGDEWRFSVAILVNRGEVWEQFDRTFRSIETACQGLYPAIFGHQELHGVTITSLGFYRKGQKLYEATYNGDALACLHAAGHLSWALVVAMENGAQPKDYHEYCFNPGCPEKAVSTYRLKFEYCRRGHKTEPKFEPPLRRFCRRHLKRGNAGLEDADANYVVVSGPGPDRAKGYEDDISPARFGGVIDLRGEK